MKTAHASQVRDRTKLRKTLKLIAAAKAAESSGDVQTARERLAKARAIIEPLLAKPLLLPVRRFLEKAVSKIDEMVAARIAR